MRRSDAAQAAASEHGDGPALVIAGPGSGKTFTIIKRIIHLIKDLNINPNNILTLTFTKAAAKEMKERALSHLGKDAAHLTFGTFHSVFYSILKQTYGLSAGNIIRSEKRYIMLRDLILKEDIETADMTETVDELAGLISRLKTGTLIMEPEKDYGYFNASQLQKLCDGYADSLKRARKIDFDDMTVKCRELIGHDEKTRAYWSGRYRYIQIDEFQDIDPMQYETIRLLAGENMNIFAVGDDDQSIYSFRGACPHMMQEYIEDNDGIKVYRLSMNYRCTEPIVCSAVSVIEGNSDRLPKTQTAFVKPGDPVDIRCFDGREEEIDAILRTSDPDHPESVAVLLRTNELASYYADRISARGIRVRMRGRGRSIYDTETGKDIRAYLRLASGRYDRSDILRVVNRPERYIGREAFVGEKASLKDAIAYYARLPGVRESAERFVSDMERMGRMKPASSLRYLMKVVGYEQYMEKEMPENAGEDMEKICEIAGSYGSVGEWLKDIESGKTSEAFGEEARGMNVMTMHACKGLEFDEVFIADVNEGIIPYHRAVLPAEIEEERRLLYVAMTRACRKLHIFYLKSNCGRRLQPSVFLDTVPSDRSHE
jgi:DNA helicase-2/ATP-dependent DNA helicase PcrA